MTRSLRFVWMGLFELFVKNFAQQTATILKKALQHADDAALSNYVTNAANAGIRLVYSDRSC